MVERLVVVGGDAAGMSAASQARRLRGPGELEIVALERGSTTSYSACGIPYWIGGLVDERDDLVARTPDEFRARQAIDARVHHEVVRIDADGRTVDVHDLRGGRTTSLAWDHLLIATGATPIRPPISGIDADGVLGVQTLDDGAEVIQALDERRPSRVVVVGAGYIGVEMAEAFLLRGLQVDVVDGADQPMQTLDDDMGERIGDAMRAMGIGLHLGETVGEIVVGDDGWVEGVVTSAAALPADLVVLGTGMRPASALAADAGIAIGPSGGIVTDRAQRTPTAGVWAAGDCAQTLHRVSGAPVSIPLGTIANKQGRVAGRSIAGASGTFPGVLGTAVAKVCGLEIARTGLSTREARAAGFTPVVDVTTSSTRAGYYPDARPITTKVIAEHASGRLLGAQIVGEEGAAKRIDVFATALWCGMTLEDLMQVDLGYAPPFAPVWDPVLVAARRGWSTVVEAMHDGP